MASQEYLLIGLVEVSVKKDFMPRVTHGTILHQQNLEYIMVQFKPIQPWFYSMAKFILLFLV